MSAAGPADLNAAARAGAGSAENSGGNAPGAGSCTRASWLGRAAPWLLVLACGVTVRLFRVLEQVPFGDELHALSASVFLPVGELLSTYSTTADHTPPLAALWRVLRLLGVPITEGLLRAPSLLAGLLLLALAPRAVRALGARSGDAFGAPRSGDGAGAPRSGDAFGAPRSGDAVGAPRSGDAFGAPRSGDAFGAPRSALLFAWLVALAPGLVFYSRIARPYMPVVLCAGAALYAFVRWWREPRWPSALAYVAAAALASWLFVGAAPFVASVFLFGAASKAIARRGGPSLPALAALASGFAAALALFLVPAFRSFTGLLRGVATSEPLTPAAVLGTAQWLAGTRAPLPAVVFWLVAVCGLAVLWRRHRLLGAVTACAVACELAALYTLRPGGFQSPVMAGRFVLVVLPAVLLWVAVGLSALGARLAERWRAPGPVLASAGAVVVAAWFCAGPFCDRAVLWSSYLHSEDFLSFEARPRLAMPAEHVPAVYRRLAALEEPGAVLEYTGSPSWYHVAVLVAYQKEHRRPVFFAAEDRELYAPGLRLRHLVSPDAPSFLAAPARFLVIHRAPGRESDRLVAPGWPERYRLAPDRRRLARRLAGRMERQLRRSWGAPWYADEDVVVWDLAGLRPEVGSGPRPRG